MEDISVAEETEPLPDASQKTPPELGEGLELQQPGDSEDRRPSTPIREPSTSTTPSVCPLIHPQLPCAQVSAVSALQSKVKALSERKERARREPTKRVQEKKVATVPYGLGSPLTGAWTSSSSDEEVEPHTRLLSFPPGDPETHMDLNGISFPAIPALPRVHGDGDSPENLSDDVCSVQGDSTCHKQWIPPKGLWKTARPETLMLNADAPPVRDFSSAGTVPGGRGMVPATRRELQRSDSLEIHLLRYMRNEADSMSPEAQMGLLWRADSLESVCSSTSSSMSLAERVEMNRTLLRQMLQKAQKKDCQGGLISGHRSENPQQGSTKGLRPVNDSEGDSGISLQDSEHNPKAFVSGDDLPLSPRHEQAKRLLERARMKARAYPLKADHTILPVQRDNPELLSRVGAPLRWAPLAGKEGVVAVSGSLSDSSSGESVCSARRRYGQSPTRVRFEDESEKDAEVRYLERLRQRRRAGERAQGLLVSKPNISSYVNGRSETGRSGEHGRGPEDPALWIKKARKSQENLSNGNAHYKTIPQEAVSQKCNSCGTLLDGVSSTSNLSPAPNPLPLHSISVNGGNEGKTIPCWVTPTLPNRMVRIEQIKETYIGAVNPVNGLDSDGQYNNMADDGSNGGTLTKQKRRGRSVERMIEAGDSGTSRVAAQGPLENVRPVPNGAEVHLSNGTTMLLPNPYATEQSGQRVPAGHTSVYPSTEPPAVPPSQDDTPTPPLLQSIPQPPSQPKKSALKSGSKSRANCQRVVKLMPSPQYRLVLLDSPEEGGTLETRTPEQLSSGVGGSALVGSCPSLGISSSSGSRGSPLKHSATHGSPAYAATENGEPASQTAVTEQHQGTGEFRPDLTAGSVSTYCRVTDGQARAPMRAEHQREDSPSPSHRALTDADHREGRPKLSLRRFFSAMGLNSAGKLGKGRSSSMDQLNIQTKSSTASPSPAHRQQNQLKKAPSLQSLRLGSPFLQLRKSSSVQSLQSPKRKGDRSTAYTPGEQPCSPALARGLQRTLSVEDVGSPSAVRSVGRVAQAFSDGTLLLELNRPPNGPFGFLISRGKGRRDSGVYVEEMGDSSTQKLYAGLLGVGDEILEVNGEKVAGLSLELVTQLMTQNSTASIRVLRHRPLQR
ncbi:uncharacterized protein KIAA1614 homolog [Chanos chanos]|uniref:Uncharacterized protein KIAA1614 homolog n=1 Tax=Chanos chanos TaxID=29144 RepID=A0A6J2WS99_CHACN|nr:uncharacterized protein KIAA1614 homolog [Chanos chanos]